jgi:hypothetical protein
MWSLMTCNKYWKKTIPIFTTLLIRRKRQPMQNIIPIPWARRPIVQQTYLTYYLLKKSMAMSYSLVYIILLQEPCLGILISLRIVWIYSSWHTSHDSIDYSIFIALCICIATETQRNKTMTIKWSSPNCTKVFRSHCDHPV